MNAIVSYTDLIKELDISFPDYPGYLGEFRRVIDDNETVYFTFFAQYLREHWQDSSLQMRLALFLDKMAAFRDESMPSILDAFLLDLYLGFQEHAITIEAFLRIINPVLKDRMIDNYNYYIEANRKAAIGNS